MDIWYAREPTHVEFSNEIHFLFLIMLLLEQYSCSRIPSFMGDLVRIGGFSETDMLMIDFPHVCQALMTP